MPELERFFHYRNLDVSTLKELARRWMPSVEHGLQEAIGASGAADIEESISELRHYRAHMFVPRAHG